MREEMVEGSRGRNHYCIRNGKIIRNLGQGKGMSVLVEGVSVCLSRKKEEWMYIRRKGLMVK